MSTIEYSEKSIDSLQNEKANDVWGDEDHCHLCGRKLGKNPKMIHLLTTGNITNNPDGYVKNSQGFFPIGSECAKKLPKDFTFTI